MPVRDLVTHDLPVFAENGAKTEAMAELWDGAARGVDEALVVLLGRGVGLAVVCDGRLAHGLMSSAGEWGHVKIVRDGAGVPLRWSRVRRGVPRRRCDSRRLA